MTDLLGLQRLALLGREKEIQTIQTACRRCQKSKQAQIVLIEGKGGIGKTHLLRHVAHLAKGRTWGVSEDILDLDNPEYATPWGLAKGIVTAAAGGWKQAPESVQKAWDTAYQSLRRGNLKTLQDNWQALEKALSRYLRGKAHQGIFILRLDTAERLREAIEDEKPGSARQKEYPWELSIGRWLIRLLKQTQDLPLLWLIAGRPASTPQNDVLISAFQQAFGERLQSIRLQTLPEEARKAYLTLLSQAIESDDPGGAKRLRAYLRAHSEAFSQATEGYPLYMALAADILRMGGKLPEVFCTPTSENSFCTSKAFDSKSKDKGKATPDPRTLAEEIHKALMQALIAERSALGYILEKMARARLGTSEATLNQWWREAQEIGLNAPTGWDFKELKNRLQNLVTVKYFPRRRRAYFLHDEIYDFINKTWPLGNKDSRKPILEIVLQDYKEEQRDHLPLAYRHQIEAEEIYYRIWHQPWKGYPYYLAEANDWAKTSPLAFRRLIRYMQRLRRWMLDTEGREETRPFWDFWQLEHRFHDAALWGGRYEDVEKARQILPSELPETSPSPQIPLILRTLHALTNALLAYYEKQDYEEHSNLQKAEEILQQLEAEWDKGDTTQLLHAILDNHSGLWHRRQGRLRDAQSRYRKALRALRHYQLEGTAGVLINLAYVEVLLAHPRAAEGLLQEAKRRANPTDKKTLVRLHNVSTFHYALIENPAAAATSAKRVLQICAEEDYPRFRALTLMHWARALRGGWNSAIAWGTDMDETLPTTIVAGLRRVLSKDETAKVITGLKHEEPFLEIWDKPFGELGGPICIETAWDLRKRLRSDEIAELYREIGRLWREWAWARHRQGQKETAQRLGKAAETYFWYAATGQTTPPQVWWEEEQDKVAKWVKEQEKKVGPFSPLAALTDLLWHYHYQKLIQHTAEAEICRWAIPLFPESYRAKWENWPPQAKEQPPAAGPDDPRLWGQLGKIYMLWGHSCLRALRELETTQEKEDCLRQAVDKIALSLEYDNLLGGNSSSLQRAEANLHDWLIRHGHEPLDGSTVLEGFVMQTRNFCKEKGNQCGRLQKFIEERFT